MLRDASQRGSAVEGAAFASCCDAPQHEGGEGAVLHFGQTNPSIVFGQTRSTCGCRKASLVQLPCFAPVLYREPCNSNVSRRNGGDFGQTIPTCLSLGSPPRKRHFRRTTAEQPAEQAEPTSGQLKARHISAKTGSIAPLLERTRHGTRAP